LHRLQDEDPALTVRRDDETHQTVLSGMGETHLAIVTERLHRKFGVEVEVEDLKVPFRETITKQAEAEGKYKKQTGGHGQFGEAMAKAGPVILEPVSLVEVTVPASYQGDVMGDLNSRRGRVQGTESGNDGEQIIVALVPTSEIMRYAIDLRSLTGGRGRFTA